MQSILFGTNTEREEENDQSIKRNLCQSLQVLELILPWSLPGRQYESSTSSSPTSSSSTSTSSSTSMPSSSPPPWNEFSGSCENSFHLSQLHQRNHLKLVPAQNTPFNQYPSIALHLSLSFTLTFTHYTFSLLNVLSIQPWDFFQITTTA